MTRPRIKICGITNQADADLAVGLGADALGLVFWPSSPRAVSPSVAAEIVASVPAMVTCVGVFVDAGPNEVADIVSTVSLDAVQLHGDEDPLAFRSIGARVIKALAPQTESQADDAARLPSWVTVLLDASDRERRGGTGRLADWALARGLARRRPVILAGGLTSDNVGSALDAVQPWALDVSSGVESEPGRKDQGRLAAFFSAVDAQQETT